MASRSFCAYTLDVLEMDMYKETFREFLSSYHKEQCSNLLMEFDHTIHYSLNIKFRSVHMYVCELVLYVSVIGRERNITSCPVVFCPVLCPSVSLFFSSVSVSILCIFLFFVCYVRLSLSLPFYLRTHSPYTCFVVTSPLLQCLSPL